MCYEHGIKYTHLCGLCDTCCGVVCLGHVDTVRMLLDIRGCDVDILGRLCYLL